MNYMRIKESDRKTKQKKMKSKIPFLGIAGTKQMRRTKWKNQENVKTNFGRGLLMVIP